MSSESPTNNLKVNIHPLGEHGIKRRQINRFAVGIVEGLVEKGYRAYLVGGCVRDLLLGLKPKDFDIATNATPEQVHKTFRYSRIIGRRFRLVHVYTRGELIEVATFRGAAQSQDASHDASGRILSDNTFGSMAEDAVRRDFTINALFYDPIKQEIHDFVGGYADVLERKLKVIGDPESRYREDPVRVLRAARFVAKLGVSTDSGSEEPIRSAGKLLGNVPSARLYDELLKLFLSGQAVNSMAALQEWGLMHHLFPQLKCDRDNRVIEGKVLRQALINTDQRIRERKPVTPAFLYAALLWQPVSKLATSYGERGYSPQDALTVAGDEIIAKQCQRTAIPRRFSGVTKVIWSMQPRFVNTKGRRANALLNQRKFRAAYDFLLLRALEDESLESLAKWWTDIQEVSQEQREQQIFGDSKRKSQRPRRRKSKPASNDTSTSK